MKKKFTKNMADTIEDHIYGKIKTFLLKLDWNVIAGEPPGGTNHLPVLEIRDPEYRGRGSKGSKKIDLIAYKKNYLLILELKASYNEKDVIKLDNIVSDRSWRAEFVNGLDSKRILENANIEINKNNFIESQRFLIKALGYNTQTIKCPDDYVIFHFYNKNVDEPRIICGSNLDITVKNLFIFEK